MRSNGPASSSVLASSTSCHVETPGILLVARRRSEQDVGTAWNAVEIGPRRDLMDELAQATRMHGMKFGFYYGLYEWYNPDQTIAYAKPAHFAAQRVFAVFDDSLNPHTGLLVLGQRD